MLAAPDKRARWETAGGGYGIHCSDMDEDSSTEGLLRGAPARHPLRKSQRETKLALERAKELK